MAYFEHSYVNTGYDENSQSPPVEETKQTIVNFVYDINTDDTQNAINNFHYNSISENSSLGQAITTFYYNSYADLLQRITNFNYSAFGLSSKIVIFNYESVPENLFLEAGVSFHYDAELAIFNQSIYLINYNINKSQNNGGRIWRKGVDD